MLKKQEQVIQFTQGMDTKPNADLQSLSSMRAVANLRFDELGKLVKRPTYDEATTAPSAIASVAKRGLEPIILTDSDGYQLRQDAGLIALDPVHAVAADVDTWAVASAQAGDTSTGIGHACCVYHSATDTLVIAWCVASLRSTGAAGYAIHAKAIDATTRSVVTAETVLVSGLAGGVNEAPPHIDGCATSATGIDGVTLVINYFDLATPLKAVVWDQTTKTFGSPTSLSGSPVAIYHAVCSSESGLFAVAYSPYPAANAVIQKRTVAAIYASATTSTQRVYVAIAQSPSGQTCLASTNVAGDLLVEGFVGSASTVHAIGSGSGAGRPSIAFDGADGADDYFVVCRGYVSAAAAPIPASSYAYAFRAYLTGDVYSGGTGSPIPSVFTQGAVSCDDRAYTILVPATYDATYVALETPTLYLARWDDANGSELTCERVAQCLHDQYTIAGIAFISSTLCPTAGDGRIWIAAPGAPASSRVSSVVAATVFDLPRGQACFVAQVNVGSSTSGPRVSVETGGVALVAGAIPVTLDGVMANASGFAGAPWIKAVDNGAGGTVNGDFSWRAVYTRVDAEGNLHRSSPSVATSLSGLVNRHVNLYVRRPPLAGAAPYGVEVYATTNGGSTYYLCGRSPALGGLDAELSKALPDWTTAGQDSLHVYTDAYAPPDTSMPQLYTQGGELRAEPPPPLLSVAVVGDRVWGVDAEDRQRIWYSKPLVRGYAPEWNTACSLFVGAGATGVSDVGGVPTIFTASGIWQVYGDGPNANGSGSFAPARRLPHEVECIHPTSICKTPIGVIFRGRRGLYLLGNGLDLDPLGLPVDASMRATSATHYTRCVYDEVHNEVRVIDSTNGLFVLNLLEKKWTVWSQSQARQYQTDAVAIGGRVWYANLASGSVYAIRRECLASDAVASTEAWSVTTPWIRLDGVTGFGRLWKVILSLRTSTGLSNVASISVSLYADGDDSTAVGSASWTGAQLAALATAGQVVDLEIHPMVQRVRSLKVVIGETCTSAYAGSTPLEMRVIYGVQPGAVKPKTGAAKSLT